MQFANPWAPALCTFALILLLLAFGCGARRRSRISEVPQDGGRFLPQADGSAGDDSGVDGGHTDAGARPDSGRTAPRAPVILSLRTSAPDLTPDSPLTISAVVTDPDGIEDLIGGELFAADTGAVYGAFATAAGEGAYSLQITWAQADSMAPIDAPPAGLSRTLRARFFDAGGLDAVQDVPVLLRCASDGTLAACDGVCNGRARCGTACVDVRDDENNCGACEFRCDPSARCEGGACRWSAETNTRVSCDSLCATEGGACFPASHEARYCSSGCSSGADIRYRNVGCADVPSATITEDLRTFEYNYLQCSCAVSADGVSICASGPENTTETCADGCSNDGDRYVDCEDFDCGDVPSCR